MAEAKKSVYRHVVMFKFKKESKKSDIEKVEKAFIGLKDKIDTIIDFEWGTNVSPEKHDKGFTHVFLVTFKDRAGLDVYLPHPAHKEFVSVLLPHLDEVKVLDYETGK